MKPYVLKDIAAFNVKVDPMTERQIQRVTGQYKVEVEQFEKYSHIVGTVPRVYGKDYLLGFLDALGVQVQEPRCDRCSHGVSEHGDRALVACMHEPIFVEGKQGMIRKKGEACNCTGWKSREKQAL